MRAISNAHRSVARCAFSLVEVIVALGIFAGGILVVLALFPIANKSEALGRQAAETAERLLAQLRSQPFADVTPWLQMPDEFIASDAVAENAPTPSSRCYYGSLDGQRLGVFNDLIWVGHEADRYFEIALVRNSALSPPEQDAARGWLAFSLRVRWPVFPPRAGGSQLGGEGRESVASNVGQRQWCTVSGSVRR